MKVVKQQTTGVLSLNVYVLFAAWFHKLEKGHNLVWTYFDTGYHDKTLSPYRLWTFASNIFQIHAPLAQKTRVSLYNVRFAQQ